jgi:hypothetical protein
LNGNQGSLGGAAFYSTMYNCILTGNSAGQGGGTYGGSLYNCMISSNSAVTDGGGINRVTLYNCTVVGNSAGSGGGGGAAIGTLYNSIIYFNNSGGNYAYSPSFTNCCTSPSNATGWAVGNITNAPSFVNANAGNYRLSLGSPCINAGLNQSWMATNRVDLDGYGRIDRYSGIVDMGCYEYLPSGFMMTVP